MFDGIFFLAYPRGDKNRVTVIDLMNCVSYERDEWANVNDCTYSTAKEAIHAGRCLAKKYDLIYETFDARYSENNKASEKDGYIY